MQAAREKLKEKVQNITRPSPPISTLQIKEDGNVVKPTDVKKQKFNKQPTAMEKILSATKSSVVAGLSQATHFTTQVAIDKAFDWWHQGDQFSGPVESRYTSFLIHLKIPTISDFQPQPLHPFQQIQNVVVLPAPLDCLFQQDLVLANHLQ